MRRGKPGGSRADDRHPQSFRLAVFARRQETGHVGHFFEAVALARVEALWVAKMVAELVRDKSFERADGDGLVYGCTPAGRFAGSAANPSALSCVRFFRLRLRARRDLIRFF
jgi:hypothetical protein